MDIKFLNSLISVLEHGSIAAAARAENITSTAISQRIRCLETELGCQLLSRVGHKALPTEQCLKIEPSARDIIARFQTLKQQALNGEVLGDLKLGAISTALNDLVPDLARSLKVLAPKSTLSVTPGSSVQLYERLLSSDIDGALLVAPKFKLPKSLKSTHIASQPLGLITDSTFELTTVEQALENQPLIVYDRFSWGGELAWDWISTNSQQNKILCEIDSLETIACMVEQGLGVAVVPTWVDLHIRYKLTVNKISQQSKHERDIVFLANLASPLQGLLSACHDHLLKK